MRQARTEDRSPDMASAEQRLRMDDMQAARTAAWAAEGGVCAAAWPGIPSRPRIAAATSAGRIMNHLTGENGMESVI